MALAEMKRVRAMDRQREDGAAHGDDEHHLAVNSALNNAVAADDHVLVLGEDVGKFGDVFRATAGLYSLAPSASSIHRYQGWHYQYGDRYGSVRDATWC